MDVLYHLALSSVILTDSSTESPVHVLMLSTQAVRGLPRLRAPDHATVQSINQSIMHFRVVQVTKSLQDPLEVGNNLPGISRMFRRQPKGHTFREA